MKKNKKDVLVITIMVLVLIIGITYAYFKIVKETSFKMSIYDLDITFNDGDLINSKKLYPIDESKIPTEGIKKEFTIAKKNETDKDVYTKISLVDIELDSAARDKDLRWRLLKNNNILTEGSFINLGDNNKLELATNIKLTTTKLDSYTLYIWIQETNYPQRESLMNKSISAKIEVEGMLTEYNVVPNEGKLDNGMIPVIYNEESEQWIKAGGNLGWYDYDNQIWANAVTVYPDHRNEYMESEIGTPINMKDINTMWVWIPRYKYKIPSSMGRGTNTPPEIDVVFETGTEATGVTEKEYRDSFGNCSYDCKSENYYTHPAFRDGTKVKNTVDYDIGGWDHELTGMWVGKFENGTDNIDCNTNPSTDNCQNVNSIIKPDVKSLVYQYFKDNFITSLKFSGGIFNEETGEVTFSGNQLYGLNNNTDTHMMKNTEWGIAAYLSQSKYGKKGNPNYDGEEQKVYANTSTEFYTGRSTGVSLGSKSKLGAYSYNNYKCLDTDTTICTGDKENYKGVGASTTGTIYGIYDMAGGTWEKVMGGSADFNENFTVFPSNKYYDSYSTDYILGDATWETQGWYGGSATRPSGNQTFGRGHTLGSAEPRSTIFSYDYFFASYYNIDSRGFHTVLIP